MKKIFLVLTCLLLALVFTGCTATAATPILTGRKPWQLIELSKDSREKMGFSAKRYSYSNNGLTPTELADGSLTFGLKESATNITNLKTSLTLNFNGNSDHYGKTDTLESEVNFNSVDMLPVYSQKTLYRPSLQVSVADPYKGYTTETDYVTGKKSTVKPLDGESKDFSLKSGTYYDNEQLYHIVRAIPNLTAGSTFTFNILTPYDMYVNKKFLTHKMKITVASELVKLEVPKSIFDMAIPRSEGESGKLDDGGKYSLDCIGVQISLDSKKSGPSFYMYLSDLKFIDNELIRNDVSKHSQSYTNKVPVKILAEEYSLSGIRTYTNEYNLISYSTL